MYGATQGNGAASERMYRERFPGRKKHPDCQTFERIHRELRTSGTFYASRRGTGIGRHRRTHSLEQRILSTVDNNFSTSLRAVGSALGVSHQSVLRTLHEDRMHPYHLQRVQTITPDDYSRRLNFATWYLQQTAENQTFPADVLFTDEATFTWSEDLVARLSVAAVHVIDIPDVFSDLSRSMRRRCECCVTVGGRTFEHLFDEAHFWLNSYVNKQNCRIWSEANPQVYVETPLHPEKLTVWCALWFGGILLQKR
ncbi:uncharacterized protein TNCV_2992291 [Trichonephila clavipes]|nr:uncharacterized protein TNCV_2992291 [Trichonephila clavipes]